MKTILIILLGLTLCMGSYGQDGSDMRHFKVHGVDSTLIGKYVHFDFFNRSFQVRGLNRSLDTVNIQIDGKPVKFREVRTDDGFNNWFSRQHLQSIEKIDGLTIRIPKFRLDSLLDSSFHVTMFLEFYDDKGVLFIDRSRQQKYEVDKSIITEVLVKS